MTSLTTQSESSGWNSFKNFFSPHHQFKKFGLHVNEIPKGIIAFKVISWSSFFLTLGLCYRFKPTSRFLKSNFGQRNMLYFKTKYPNLTTKFNDKINILTKKMEENTYFKKIPDMLGLKSKRFSKALVENVIFCKFALPITLPLYFYFATEYVKYSRKPSN